MQKDNTHCSLGAAALGVVTAALRTFGHWVTYNTVNVHSVFLCRFPLPLSSSINASLEQMRKKPP